jgi:hypothetical protein
MEIANYSVFHTTDNFERRIRNNPEYQNLTQAGVWRIYCSP